MSVSGKEHFNSRDDKNMTCEIFEIHCTYGRRRRKEADEVGDDGEEEVKE